MRVINQLQGWATCVGHDLRMRPVLLPSSSSRWVVRSGLLVGHLLWAACG
jgi:hypothetical protein